MENLAWTAEGSKTTGGQPSLWADALNYIPIRNAVAHTTLVTTDAKDLLNLTFRNMKARLKTLLGQLK